MCVRALARKPFLPHNFDYMEPLLKLACLIDTQSILKYVNIGLTVLLILVLGVLVLVFLRGLLRGWKYGTYRLIFFAIMVTVVLATLGAQANALGGMDLTRFNLPSLNFTLTIDEVEHAISVKWTTLQDSLEDLIIQVAEAFGANGSYSGMLSYASVLATSFIKLLLIFFWGILLSTLGLLLIMLLWHIIFKRFTPIDRRKIKKLRVVSAFEELLIGAACLGMLLSPFTSIVNSMNSNFKVEDEQAKQNETVSMITDILGVYDQSAFAKTFFSWNSMDGSTTFDQQLISFLTQSEVKEVKTDLVSEISAIANVSSKAINAGLLSAQGSEGIRWYLLLSSSSIPELIYALSETKLIQCALPFAVSLAVNLDAVKSVLGEETCKYLSDTEVDWTEAIQSMSRIYENILDAGIIDCVVDVENGSATPMFDWTQLQYVFSGKDASGNERDAKAAMHNLTSEFEDSALFSHLMAGLLSQLGKTELEKETRADLSILDFLPLAEDGKSIDYQALVNLNYTKEFNLLYDTIYSINDVSPEVVSGVLDLVQNPPTEEDSQDKYRSLLSKSAKYAESYVELVVGERDENGEPKDDSKDCLFDSVFVGNALPALVPYIEKAGSSALDMDLKLTNTKEELKGWELKDYKREFGATLDVAAKFASSDAGLAFLEDGTGMAYKDKKLISIDPELVKALQNSLELGDKSKIMTEALPQVAEKYFEDFRTTLSEFGIEDVDFKCENFGSELSYLLNLLSYSGDLILALNNIQGASTHLMATMLLEEKDSLVRVLDIFAGSKILNPVDSDSGKTNMNIASLLNYVFSSAGLEDFKLEADALDGMILVSERVNNDIGGEVTSPHENALIVDAITSVPLSELMALGGASSSEMMKALSKIDVETLFTNIGKSEVMRSVAGSAMDKYFTSMLDVGEGDGISFKNLVTAEEWEKEGRTIQKIVNLATNGIDISDFDINDVSPSLVKDLFSNLANSQIFLKKTTGADGTVMTEYMFPKFFSSKILGMLDKDSLPYFLDKDATLPSDLDDLDAKKNSCKTFVDNCLALEEASDWTKSGGEIDIFSKVLSGVQSLGGFASISSFSRDNLPKVRGLLENIASSSCFGQVLLANALGQALSSMGSSTSSSSLDLSLANSDVFFDGEFKDVEARKGEVGTLCDVMDVLFDQNYGLLNADGSFNDSSLNVSSLSVDNCLKPLLDGIASSKVLNTKKEGSSDTLLRSTVKMVLVKSSLYKVDDEDEEFALDYAGSMSISNIVDALSDEELSDEIDKLCSVIKLVQGSSLLKGDSFDASSLKSVSKEELISLLGQINDSKLLYRSLAIQIESAVKSAALPSPFQEDLERCCPYLRDETNTSKLDYAPYSEEEIDCVASLLSSVNQFSSLDFTKISEISKVDFSDLLSPLFASQIFNEQHTDPSKGGDGFTSAQSFLVHILSEMGLDDLIYSSSSPKDSALGIVSADEKYSYLVKTYIGASEEGNYEKYSLDKQKEESNAFYKYLGAGEESLTTFLSNLSKHNLGSLLEGGSIDFDGLTSSGSTLSYLLKDLSHCTFLKDVPINALAKYLSSDLSVDGIDLSLTNYYYPYFYDAENSTAIKDWDRGYDDNEIDLLVDLLDLIQNNKDDLEQDRIDALDPYILRQLLWELDDSLLFNVTGINKYSANYNKGWESGNYISSASGAAVTSDLTVFQQMIYLVYENSGLATRSFDAYHDFDYLVAANYDEDLATKLKLHGGIKNLAKGSTAPTDWRNEIGAITTDDAGETGLIKIAQDSGLLDSDGQVDTSTDFLKKLSPGNAMLLMRTIGRSRICGDALATTISSFLTSGEEGVEGLGVETFSTYKKSVGVASSFTSDPAFLGNGVKYEDLYFTSSSYDGTETFTLKGDVDGDGTYEKDLSSFVAYEYKNHEWNFGVSKIGCNFQFTISKEGSLSYMFDTAKYYLPYGSLEEGKTDSNSLEWFLCSLRKADGTYYSFEGKASALKEAFEANIPLYGIAAIVMESGIYTASHFDSDFVPTSDDGAFSSSAYSLYEMFSLTDSSSGVTIQVNLFDAVDAPRLEAEYPTGVPSTAHYSSIETLVKGENDPFAEGKFFEKALIGSEASEIAHQLIENAFSSSTYDDATKTAAYRYASSFLTTESYRYADFLSSGCLDYSYLINNEVDPSYTKEKLSSKSVFADYLIADAINDRISERLEYAKLSSHTIGGVPLVSPTDSSKTRLSFLSSGDQALLTSLDAYGYDSSSKTYDFSGLTSLASSETKATRFTALISTGITVSSSGISYTSLDDCLLSAEQKTELGEICGVLDGMSGNEKALANLAYTADAYDYFLFKGRAASNAYQDYFFHGDIGATPLTPACSATDFPSTYENGVLLGNSIAFSYQNVAKANLYA